MDDFGGIQRRGTPRGDGTEVEHNLRYFQGQMGNCAKCQQNQSTGYLLELLKRTYNSAMQAWVRLANEDN